MHHSELQVIQVIAKHDGPSFGKKATRTDKKKTQASSAIIYHVALRQRSPKMLPYASRAVSHIHSCSLRYSLTMTGTLVGGSIP